MTMTKRNRPKIEGRCSPEVPQLVDQLQKKIPGANKSDVLETAVRLLAETFGIVVPMNDLTNRCPMPDDSRLYAKARALEHFDRARSEYERARFEASSLGGTMKRENARNGTV